MATLTIDRERSYSPNKSIEKEVCVNHVTKRMSTNLRALVREYKGKKLADGKHSSGKDSLKIIRIDTIQNFYDRAIRDNNGNPQKMLEEIWPVLDHYSSAESNPNHDKCPKGKKVGSCTKETKWLV